MTDVARSTPPAYPLLPVYPCPEAMSSKN